MLVVLSLSLSRTALGTIRISSGTIHDAVNEKLIRNWIRVNETTAIPTMIENNDLFDGGISPFLGVLLVLPSTIAIVHSFTCCVVE